MRAWHDICRVSFTLVAEKCLVLAVLNLGSHHHGGWIIHNPARALPRKDGYLSLIYPAWPLVDGALLVSKGRAFGASTTYGAFTN